MGFEREVAAGDEAIDHAAAFDRLRLVEDHDGKCPNVGRDDVAVDEELDQGRKHDHPHETLVPTDLDELLAEDVKNASHDWGNCPPDSGGQCGMRPVNWRVFLTAAFLHYPTP